MKQLAFIKRSNGRQWVGDGFPIQEIFSYDDVARELSPFLRLDYAGPVEFPPTDKKLGVGPHPHRGIETVTIVYEGGVAHRDSSGGGGTIGPGDVQWMTAASGLLHEEYHDADYARRGGPLEMVQLWVNLPARDKMSAPGYQAITADRIPTVELPGGAGTARIIAGEVEAGTDRHSGGPARTFTPMKVWDLRLHSGGILSLDLPEGHTAALFVLRGALRFGTHLVRSAELAVLNREGTDLEAQVAEDSVVLLLSGAPLDEPIVGYGPFVMNTHEEIRQAMMDFESGKFGQIAD